MLTGYLQILRNLSVELALASLRITNKRESVTPQYDYVIIVCGLVTFTHTDQDNQKWSEIRQ